MLRRKIGLLCFAFMLPAAAAAQNDLNDVLQRQRRAAPQDLDPSLIIVNRRQPIPFKPFEMVDVVTGRPIPPDSTLTFPDNTSAKASVYFEKLNEIERSLNEMGYSLRQDWDSIVIQRSAINNDALAAQARRIRAATNAAKPLKVRTFAEFNHEIAEQSQAEIAVMRPPLNVPAVPGPMKVATLPSSGVSRAVEAGKLNLPPPKKPGVTVTETNEYPFSIGDPKLFAASVNGKLDLAGSEENMKLTGAARAGVSIFGISSDVARLDAWVNAPKKGNMTGKVTLDVLPFGTIYNLSLDGASVSKEDNITRGVDVEFASFRVMIGPVPVKVKAGAQGNVGVKYYAGLNPASAVAEFAPIVRSNLYVQAGIDVVVAGAGAGASMTLVNYDLSMYGSLRLWTQIPDGGTKPELGIREIYTVSHKLTMLSGSAYAYAYIYVPACCVPPWKKKEWKWEMFNWDGFTPVDGNLADVTRWTSLGIPTK
jgi:hypothetical protein